MAAIRRPLPALAFAPFAVVAIVQLVSKLTGPPALDQVSKALCVPLLAAAIAIAIVLVSDRSRIEPRDRLPVALLGLALVASWIGDIAIETSFAAGLGLFLLAHLAYLTLFLVAFRGRPAIWTALLVGWYAVLVILLAPVTGSLLVPVIVYGAALGAMAAAATRAGPLAAAGGALFVVSDTVLALETFTGSPSGPGAGFAVMLAYLAAQALLALGVLGRLVAWPMASSSGSAPGTSRTRRSRASRSRG